MNWFKASQSNTFQDWFGEEMEKEKRRSVVSKDPPSSKNLIITLYRGFDADLNKLKRSGENYIFSPEKSEQGAIWFSRSINVAKGRGKYILEYPLNCIKHFQTVHFNDGSAYDDIPKEITEKSNPTENCKFFGGIELPEGWLFSYKVEKHIICTIPILIKPEMIKLDIGDNDELV